MFSPPGITEGRIRNGTLCHIFTANEKNVEAWKHNLQIPAVLTFCEGKGKSMF